MAWVTVPNSDNIWQYENTATVSDTYPDSADGANTTIAGGVRTYNKPGDENGRQELTYMRTRKTGTTVERGEVSKSYFDIK